MSNRARQRKVRFRPDDIREDDHRSKEVQKLLNRKSSSSSSSVDSTMFIVVTIVFVLLVGTGYMVYTNPHVHRWLHGARSVQGRLTWWQTSIVYQVYPRSFQDSDGDGVGDIRGIITRLDYFSELNVEALWLSPVYESPMVDFGYDVADYTAIDPLFGDMTDFTRLVQEAHNRGIYVIVDFVPNHSSDQHWWFQESRQSAAPSNPYRDYYVWHGGRLLKNGTRAPPNNWVSVFGGSMWTWDEQRGAYYLHQFSKQQPDLNYRNPTVRKEMETVIRFWLEKGVDGFRMDAVAHLFESEDLLKNELRSHKAGYSREQHEYWNHVHTAYLPEVHDVIKEWRQIIEEYEYKLDKDIFMVLEVFPENADDTMAYYTSGASMPFNFQLPKINRTCDGRCVARLVNGWLGKLPEGKWPNWVTGNHDVPRISDKMGDSFVDVMNMILLLLPGTPIYYYGEELGMRGIDVTFEETQDPFGVNAGKEHYKEVSRDPCRSPMQWSYDQNAGFSRAQKTWLPVHPDYKTVNVKMQRNDPLSHLEFYKRVAKLRRNVPFVKGDFDYGIINENIFSFIKFATKEPCYLVAANFGKEEVVADFRKYKGHFPPKGGFVPSRGFLVLNTHNGDNLELMEESFVELNNIKMKPGQGVVVRFWPPF